MLPYSEIRNAGAYRLFRLLQRCNAGEVSAWCLRIKILFQAMRGECREHVSILDLNRRAVFKVHKQQMEYIRSLLNVERLGYLSSRVLERLAHNPAGVCMPTAFYFIGDVLYFKEMRTRTVIGNKGAASRDTFNVALIIQLTQGPVRRHTRNIFRLDQFIFGGDSIGWLQFSARD